MILDERTRFGVTSVAAVHDAWRIHLERINAERAKRMLPMLEIVDRSAELEAYAYVNHSRWLCDCPAAGCGAGVFVWPDHPRACCLGCFTIFRPLFPPKGVIAQAVPVLDERPDPATRNWNHATTDRSDPKMLDRGRWTEHGAPNAAPNGWESVTRLRNENLLLGGLSGDGTGQDIIHNPRLLAPNGGRGVTTRTTLDTGDVELPSDAQTSPAPGAPDPGR